jgi:hypothetical protein
LNHHRIHTPFHRVRHEPLTGSPDLVFHELPLKMYRPPHQPRSNEKCENRADRPLHDQKSPTREASLGILRMSFMLNNLLVRHRLSTIPVKISHEPGLFMKNQSQEPEDILPERGNHEHRFSFLGSMLHDSSQSDHTNDDTPASSM